MVRKKRDSFAGSLGGGNQQGMLFDIHEPALSEHASGLLFNPATQWSLHLGTIPSIGLAESMKRRAAGDENIPVHDVKLLIALPLSADRKQAEALVQELLPDAGPDAASNVFVRQDRLVSKPRMARGEEAAWGRRDRKEQWVSGVSIEITQPQQVARFMEAARAAPKTLKIDTHYNQDWFTGTPPMPDGHFQDVLAASGIDARLFTRMRFDEASSFSHESGLKDLLESRSPAGSRGVKP
jgi:hypothetical protein